MWFTVNDDQAAARHRARIDDDGSTDAGDASCGAAVLDGAETVVVATVTSVAQAAAQTVEAVQAEADELALAVSDAAAQAVATVADCLVDGGNADSARVAREMSATVLSAAVAKAEETARAAVLVARAVAEAAAAVASTTAAAAAPVMIDADGIAVALDDTTDLLLGVQPTVARHDRTQSVPPGATLPLYTDGLVETRTHDIDIGQLRLLAAAHTHHGRETGTCSTPC